MPPTTVISFRAKNNLVFIAFNHKTPNSMRFLNQDQLFHIFRDLKENYVSNFVSLSLILKLKICNVAFNVKFMCVTKMKSQIVFIYCLVDNAFTHHLLQINELVVIR